MKRLLVLALVMSCGFEAARAQDATAPLSLRASEPCRKPAFPGREWKPASSADTKSWSRPKLTVAENYASSLHDSSLMVVECGHLVDVWGDTAKKLTTFSVRKSLISALYGIYAAEGKIDINETLEQAGIDDTPSPLTKEERQAKIVDLLRARSGVYHAAAFEVDFQRKGRPARGSHAPGTFWWYNNWDFNVLGTIFEKKTGLTIGEAFYERIAKPLGMQDFQPGDVYFIGDSSVSMHPAYMFRMTARDMARFGLLYLDHGRWKGRQIVPADWVEKSSHTNEMVHLGHMKLGGYEYLWWVEYGGIHIPEATLPGMYSAQGAGGHYILVVPSRNTVIVNQFDNEPDAYTSASVLRAAQNPHQVFDDQFGHLVKLILDAQGNG